MEKFKAKLQNLKGVIAKHKKQTAIISIAVIAVIVLAVTLIYQNVSQKGFGVITPELAKALTYDRVEEGEEAVEGTDNVKFDAFFLRDLNNDGYAEGVRGTSKQIGQEDTLYMELNVQTAGYLKDAKIEINGENFYLQTALPADEELKDNYIGNNIKTIEFNQINNGTQKTLTGIVRSGDYSYSSRKADAIGNNINNYSKVNSVTLTGTYVADGGTETPITKTVNFNIDWYGETEASLSGLQNGTTSDLESRLNSEERTVTLDFSFSTSETVNELILKSNHTEIDIPELGGQAPISAEYTGSSASSNYNAETKILTIDRTSTVGTYGNISSEISSYGSYSVRVVYPIEAFESLGEDIITLSVPVRTYYEGYNNPSQEFTNPYKSNTAEGLVVASFAIATEPEDPEPEQREANFSIVVGKYATSPYYRYMVSKQKPLEIYNGKGTDETEDTYQVRWYATTGTTGETTGITMKETKDGEAQVADEFIKSNGTRETMENVTTNIGIAFQGADGFIAEDGWIKVYDEDTGNLLATFTKDNWNSYTASNPYRYEIPVKHIRVETSNTIANTNASSSQGLNVYNIKKLDDEYITTNYTKEQFKGLNYISSTLEGYISGNHFQTKTSQASYEEPFSIANIKISNNTISTQVTEESEKITIETTQNTSNNVMGWVDGSFIVKLPEEILVAEINNVEINNSAVQLSSYELIEQDGVKLIKINTKNTNQTPQSYNITIDVDLTPDPRVATMTRQVELYAANEEVEDYYYNATDIYDVNNNLNTQEIVNHRTVSISMVSPNSLLTNQIGSNYDDKGSTVISPQIADIKPTYAVLDQEQEKTAQIGAQVRNNYTSTISDIKILGKIPFEGNTYVLSGGDLGSTFTTKMTNAGVQVPQELQQYATVYYSENENPTQDINEQSNNWKTTDQVANWDNVKTYLIDLGSYAMPTGAEYVFNYTIKIPNGLEFNQASFSHHAIYFSLDTDQGKYRTQTEPNRLGFRIAEKFNLELTKTQKDRANLILGATYSITEITENEGGEETRGETKTGVTNAQGQLTINNLYAEKVYEIQEIKTPNDYELNTEVIRFIGHVDEEGNLSIEKTQGTTKEDIAIVKNEGEDYKVTVKVEDEARASIKITKKEQGTENKLQGVRYKLTGYNLPESGRTITTNINGEATISGISINQEYTLQEVKADGYYLASPIKFKVVNNNGNYTLEQIQDETATGAIANQETTETEGIPTINITLEDEKIPTYNLQIIKVKKTTESTVSEDELIAKAETSLANTEVEYLEGAKFKLYKGTEEIGEYTTDSTGTITIEGLYQYETEKNIDQTYTLKEVLAPVGYAKVKDITFKVENKEGILVLTEINEEGKEQAGENYTVEGSTVKLTIEDSPSFRLIKKDAETKAPIANVKFAIYNVENGEVPATNSKGETIGTLETIDGKEYYTIQTDQNGEITADLTEGLYKAVEVQAPEQYDITDQTYYFGIGASREGKTTAQAQWAKGIGGSSRDYIYSVTEISDGGYIAGGYFESESIDLGNGVTLSNNGDSDGMVIKYDSDGVVQWAKGIGGSRDDRINSVAETSDGGYIAGGYFQSKSIDLGNGVILNHNSSSAGDSDGMIIKYDENGEVQWAKGIKENSSQYIYSVAEASDGGYIAGGYFEDDIDLGNGVTLNNNGSYDGMLIKYDSAGNVQWAKAIGGSSSDYIYSVASTSDGGYIAGGHFYSSSIALGNGVTLTKNGGSDGMIIKYGADGNAEWAKGIGGSSSDYIESVAETSDGGIIAGGYFSSDNIDLGNGVTLTNNGGSDGMIIKYDKDGVAQWAKGIGGSSSDYIESVAETSDGGIIAGGYFSSDNIDLGNGVTLTNKGGYDGMIIKYDENGIAQWAKGIGGSSDDYIRSVIETSDGGAIVGGYFRSSSIDLGNGVTLNNNNGYYDGMIIKYEPIEGPEIVTKQAKGIRGSDYDYINSVASTSDGGYIAGGEFSSSRLDLGNGVTLTKKGNYDGMIIKYDENGIAQWAKRIGGDGRDYINSVAEASDGGYIVGGFFESSSIDLGNGVTLTNKGNYDGMIIKYDENGEVEWAKGIGGDGRDYINSVAEASDGGYIVGGYFESESIELENGVKLENKYANNGDAYFRHSDGMIIKLDSKGNVEWAKGIGGDDYDNDQITSVAETSDRGYIAGGYFSSSSIDLGNRVTLNKNGGYYDGMIIKYDENGEVQWAKVIGGR